VEFVAAFKVMKYCNYAQDTILLKASDTIRNNVDKYDNIYPKVKNVRLVCNLMIVLSFYIL